MGTIRLVKFVFFIILCVSFQSCNRFSGNQSEGKDAGGTILFQKLKGLEPDTVLDDGTKVISRSGNKLLGMDINGYIFVTRKNGLQQMFFIGNGKDVGPDFKNGGIILQTNNLTDTIHNTIMLDDMGILIKSGTKEIRIAYDQELKIIE